MTTPIEAISIIKPKNNGLFPVVEDSDVKGGYQVVETSTDLNQLLNKEDNLKTGMLVYVIEENKYYQYQLIGMSPSWIEASVISCFNYRGVTVSGANYIYPPNSGPSFILSEDEIAVLDVTVVFSEISPGTTLGYAIYKVMVQNQLGTLAIINTPTPSETFPSPLGAGFLNITFSANISNTNQLDIYVQTNSSNELNVTAKIVPNFLIQNY